MILVIDNYDSFTFNIVHYLEGMGAHVNICRNDKIDWELVNNTQHILLSPGPGLPDKAGDLLKLINEFLNGHYLYRSTIYLIDIYQNDIRAELWYLLV